MLQNGEAEVEMRPELEDCVRRVRDGDAEIAERSVGAMKSHFFALRRELHDGIQRKHAEEASS